MSETCQSYRSATALNNIGVSLLEGGRFSAASETLKDATALIKATLRDGQTSCWEFKHATLSKWFTWLDSDCRML